MTRWTSQYSPPCDLIKVTIATVENMGDVEEFQILLQAFTLALEQRYKFLDFLTTISYLIGHGMSLFLQDKGISISLTITFSFFSKRP